MGDVQNNCCILRTIQCAYQTRCRWRVSERTSNSVEFQGFSSRRSSLTQTFVESCVYFEVSHLSILVEECVVWVCPHEGTPLSSMGVSTPITPIIPTHCFSCTIKYVYRVHVAFLCARFQFRVIILSCGVSFVKM